MTEDRTGPGDARPQQSASLPPVVYVPVSPNATTDQQEVEMRRLEDGRTALLVYTALDRLAACCGAAQPWALYQVTQLAEMNAQHPYDIVLTDQMLPGHLQRPPRDDV